MLNADRIDELRVEIRKIEEEKEDTNTYLRNYIRSEKEICEEVYDRIKICNLSFEASYGDQRWTNLVEEQYNQLLSIGNQHSDDIETLEAECKKLNSKYDKTLEDLETEIWRLEMIGGELGEL